MNPFLNSITVIGNLGKQPELRWLPDGTPTTSIHIAVTEKISNSKTGLVNEKTDWFTALLYNKHAELVCQHLKVGDSVLVRGAMRSRRYEKDGVRHMVWEIHADKVVMLQTKGQS